MAGDIVSVSALVYSPQQSEGYVASIFFFHVAPTSPPWGLDVP